LPVSGTKNVLVRDLFLNGIPPVPPPPKKPSAAKEAKGKPKEKAKEDVVATMGLEQTDVVKNLEKLGKVEDVTDTLFKDLLVSEEESYLREIQVHRAHVSLSLCLSIYIYIFISIYILILQSYQMLSAVA